MSIKKITSIENLKHLNEECKKGKLTDKGVKMQKILVCAGGGCIASGSLKVIEALQEELESHGLDKTVQIVETGCLGPCAAGPVVLMAKDQVFYQKVQPKDAVDIVEQHVFGGKIVERLAWTQKEGTEDIPLPMQMDIDFFKRQTKIVLRNCGLVDPISLEDYIGVDGFMAIAKVLEEMSPDDVIEQMKLSGLRGRGGAGFPTWLKWSFAKKSESDTKYILCNADEGDPGAFMDRSVLEGDPYSLIEGMAIGAYAIGASQGYIYVRAEYPLAVERLQKAIDTAREAGLLGKNILGKGFDFELEIRMGSGAFVCGEETALIASIEGKRGEPRPRPPFPAQKGLWDKPTVLNNVETYANIAAIIQNGGEWFASYGTEKSKGTKVFALAGAIRNSGLVEVPVGTTLGELIYDIGGGIPDGKAFKAAQVGGPSGGCIPKQHLNVQLDYESLNELGAIMGSGGLVVMDDDACMVDVARFFLEFVQEESCGKCSPCRVGTKRMLEILERICNGEGEEEDIDRLIEIGEQIKDTALCGLGQTAPNPVLSTIRHFRDEYESHIKEKHCPAGVCPGLVRAPCQSACPAKVNVPGFISLVGEKRYAEALRLHRERNPFAVVCARVCFHTCEDKCRRSMIDESVAIRAIKRFMVDQEITIQVPEVRESEDNSKRKIAVVGAGPAGLSCAYFLARLGYRPTVLEAEPRPGGMLVQTIPAYRLPRELLAREIRMIEGLGVEIETGKMLGRDFSLAQLRREGYDAVFLGVGTPKGIILDLPGKEAAGVTEAIAFLREYNLRGSVKVGKKVVVIGGGNAAIDAARTAIRLGADVTVVYRRTRAEMPAYAEEIEESQQEGVRIETLTSPTRIIDEDGKVSALVCHRMKLGEFDRSGRRRPEDSGQEVRFEADQIIFACGQKLDAESIFEDFCKETAENNYDCCAKVNDDKLEFIGRDRVKTDPLTGQTSIEWLFGGGDLTTGPASVVEAVAAGEKAAIGIDEYLTGEQHAFWRQDIQVDTAFDPDADPVEYDRKKMVLLSVDRRKNNFDEVEMPWLEGEAVRQSKRCLRCDYGKY
ncbi:MAG: NADH-quinone oxidoreductase subunit NuoF [Sedimentisphaeraceae bacterium JB056]